MGTQVAGRPACSYDGLRGNRERRGYRNENVRLAVKGASRAGRAEDYERACIPGQCDGGSV